MELASKVHDIVMEASSKTDRVYMQKMNKDDVHQINGTLLQNLYQSVLKRRDIDFGDIPSSKGDIEKCKYYANTVECLKILEELFQKNRIEDDSVVVIKKAISNMKQYRPRFMSGFKVKHELIMISYNSLTMAIVDATSMVISSYMDYLVSPEDVSFNPMMKSSKKRGNVALSSLRKFNDCCANGSFANSLDYMIAENRKALVGETVVIGAAVITALLVIIPMIRELIFFFFHTRVQVSDYLNMQSDFMEMHKLAIESSSASPEKKAKILKKQEQRITKMRKISDKLYLNDVNTNDVAKKEEQNENSLFSLGNIEKQMSNNKIEGNSLVIF